MAYFPNSSRRIRLGRPTSYPWDDWTDGQERVLREGKDFKCMAESFVILARRTAKVRGLHVTVSTATVPAEASGAHVLEVCINGNETVRLEPGGTYVLLKFAPEEAAQAS
jgi:hypothetical protein